ncbi:MAG: DUF4383 domain-containing protein [Nitrososphaera sp.]|nr:DUF4383 domain-containing protein [Nitrososphaera sp.]
MGKTLAIVFGVVFVVVGLLGFVGNPIVGMDALFVTNTLHDIVHLLVGIILLGVAFGSPNAAGMTMTVVGVIYLLLAVLGFIMISGGGMLLGLVEMSTSDHWLHLVLGVVLVAAGMKAKGSGAMSSAGMSQGGMM